MRIKIKAEKNAWKRTLNNEIGKLKIIWRELKNIQDSVVW